MVEKILAEIERLKNGDFSGTYDARYALNVIKSFIESLEKERDVDLEKEYESFVTSDPVYSKLTNGIVGKAIASHFYELGLNARKEE